MAAEALKLISSQYLGGINVVDKRDDDLFSIEDIEANPKFKKFLQLLKYNVRQATRKATRLGAPYFSYDTTVSGNGLIRIEETVSNSTSVRENNPSTERMFTIHPTLNLYIPVN